MKGTKFKMAFDRELFASAVDRVCRKFNIENLKEQQSTALYEFLCGKDVFVNLPTGYGKSLIFQMAPLVARELSSTLPGQFSSSSIVLVISPLVALMKDQVNALTELGINPFTQLTRFSGLMNLTTERTCPLFRDSDRFKLKSLELA